VEYDQIYYALNFGGNLIRFYTLNSMVSVAGDQTNWLSQDLMQNDSATIWKMAHYHYTIAPHTASKPYRIAEYSLWAPLFHQHGMHLVVECDTHVARNSWPVRPSDEPGSDGGFIRDDETGTVFVARGPGDLSARPMSNTTGHGIRAASPRVKWLHVNQDSIVS
jgi:hypothetical protein